MTPLQYCKEFIVTQLSELDAVVQCKLPLWGEEGLDNFEYRIYHLRKDASGKLLVEDIYYDSCPLRG
ncbi:hypothetical protein N752_23060 [Desulforamulus aquiferis]|nr:hypothetical protein [Desulforamulus aquiferis]RYD02894.1 hypothetical protein N752_23060 [Desulforamulus aquiferis]